jgi:hypothetical protein
LLLQEVHGMGFCDFGGKYWGQKPIIADLLLIRFRNSGSEKIVRFSGRELSLQLHRMFKWRGIS